MNQRLDIKSERKWLSKANEDSKKRIYNLGVKAIQSLIKESQDISYRAISLKSKELDKTGKGIHPNSVKNNAALYDYYLKHTNNASKTTKRVKARIGDLDYKNIKLDRDLDRVKMRYMQLSKKELVELLVNAEQYIASQNKNWIKSQFESYKS